MLLKNQPEEDVLSFSFCRSLKITLSKGIEVSLRLQGAYEKLLENSGFTYHLLMPKWTEEQTAAIYAVDQFESFSNPYTMEATFF